MKLRKLHILLLVVLAGAALWLWSSQRGGEEQPPVTAQARMGDVAETVLASGMLEARELVSVGARVSGQIETLAVQLGQSVTAGDLIAQIDSRDQENTVLQAQAALANIEAQIAARQAVLNRAELALTRAQRLGTQSLASQESVESATADVQVYVAEIASLQAQRDSAAVTVANAQMELDRTRITAPISGTVVAIVTRQGQTVNAVQAAPTIVKLADLATMLVKAEISEADVMNVAVGQNVTFTTLGAPDQPFHAVVRSIEPAPSEIETTDTLSTDSAIYYNATLEVDNSDGRLRIGMTAQVSVELARADDVLVVPSSAVQMDAQGTYVELYDAATGQTTQQPVTVGLNNKVLAEIRSGLTEGQAVVTGVALAPASTSTDQGGPPPPMGF
ncbi:MAG: efflux RND transporter periplasmic adaptor subunit [Paracoccus sp. (in: a-proteobacteria)]|uniref:efflux RND transporter periplasmic adaptor subunit n=1 Tax=Paracoccus sp. TaxID=267 RepID=UPI0026E07984|nr:efflux RND transporter periplasmic adaptor subunit [Paracoccus sp. (in: a-proteobacteria)]MDO5612708.1 efflux RND transporter periplasmic adaptor subunit [Paracoccus sp. (in: a-proteobacteria)]